MNAEKENATNQAPAMGPDTTAAVEVVKHRPGPITSRTRTSRRLT